MRSRDGDNSFSLRLCTIIFLFIISSLKAEEYYISYRYVVKDAIIYNESLQVSPAMQKCNGDTYLPLILENNKSKNLKEILSNNSLVFIDYLHKFGLNVEHEEKTSNYKNTSTTVLTLKTKCFKVDFNDNFARIAPLK
ncbi:MAG: hypothetical protein OQJ77_04375 [Thiovulaceae bacterium]|nr:hypothetical protein [Sulfurimonadaceae bacterium]MCW9026533.1 hypothetical protein [Sulfurimonadaceae bacterium]